MPMYPALPDYKPVAVSPAGAFIGGLKGYQDYQTKRLQGALAQEELEEKQRKAQALRDFQQSGDVRALTPGLEPKEAALLPGAMMKQQLETGEKAIEFFNLNKKLLTPDMYPEFYQRSIEEFGDLAKRALRPPGSFNSPEEFYAHVWELDNKNAQLKASIEMAKHRFQNVRPGGSVGDLFTGKTVYQSPIAPSPTGSSQLMLDANNNPYWAHPGQPLLPGTKPFKVGTEKQATPLSQQDQMIIDGIYAKTGGKYTKEQIAAALPAIKEQSKKTGAEATTGGQVKIDKDKSQAAAADARTDLTKEQLETKKAISTLLQALGQKPGPAVDPNQQPAGQPAAPVKPPKPNKSPYELLNRKTNTWMTLTKEQYKALTGIDK